MFKFLLLFLISFQIISAQNTEKFQYISPKPGSEFNSRDNNIVFRYGDKIDPESVEKINLITVSGSLSGIIKGKSVLSADGKTVIFYPNQRFLPSETIFVTLNKGLRTYNDKPVPETNFSFKVTLLNERLNVFDYINYDEFYGLKSNKPLSITDTVPSNFPPIRTEVFGETAPGKIFLTQGRLSLNGGFFLMIFEDNGTPYFHKEILHDEGNNFRIQPSGYYSYAENIAPVTFAGGGYVINYIMDESFTVVDSFQMGNGFLSELHEFLLEPNGHSWMMTYDLQQMDMTAYGGWPNALVAQSVIQELDVEKNVIFQWRSIDHYDFEDTYFTAFSRKEFDPVHVNSIFIDNDGHLLITSQQISDVTKINRQTGEIIWRLGGKRNMFTFIGENAEFDFGIHHITRLDNGNILLMDNAKQGTQNTSRVVEYTIDEVNMTAELVWEFVPENPIVGYFEGSAQRLPNGNTLIGWGSGSVADSIAVTEVNPDGNVVFNLYFDTDDLSSYRAYRLEPLTGTYAARDAKFEVASGNTYDFTEDPANDCGVKIKINSLVGDGYNQLIVEKFLYASTNPQFLGKEPLAAPQRIIFDQESITSINCDIKFDAYKFGIINPELYTVYYRQFPGSGLYLPIPTVFNQVTKEIIGTASGFGEFILAKPDHPAIAYTPYQYEPKDSSDVNSSENLTLRWNPVGYAVSYNLQVSYNASFSNPFINLTSVTDEFYTLSSLIENESYYWRVQTVNEGGTSEWSNPFYFEAKAPYINIVFPDGGEILSVGLSYYILWNDIVSEDIEISISPFEENNWAVIDTFESTGGYKWEIAPNQIVGNYKIRIKSLLNDNIFDVSSSAFSVSDTVTTVNSSPIVKDFYLLQNFPNPFNPSTQISFMLPISANVSIKVFNAVGEEIGEVVSGNFTNGIHSVDFDASGLSSGVYFYRITAIGNDGKSFNSTRKMLLMK